MELLSLFCNICVVFIYNLVPFYCTVLHCAYCNITFKALYISYVDTQYYKRQTLLVSSSGVDGNI